MSSGGFKSPDLVRNRNVLPFQGPLCRMPIGNANASMPDHNIRWPIPACFGGSGVISGGDFAHDLVPINSDRLAKVESYLPASPNPDRDGPSQVFYAILHEDTFLHR